MRDNSLAQLWVCSIALTQMNWAFNFGLFFLNDDILGNLEVVIVDSADDLCLSLNYGWVLFLLI